MSVFNFPLMQIPLVQIPMGQMALSAMKLLPLLLTTAAGMSVMSLGSCSTTPSATYESSDATPEGELFGDYLAGLYANHVDDANARSDHFTRAFELQPDNAGLGRRAITSAITAADFNLAIKLAGEVKQLGSGEPMANAVLGTRDFKSGRYVKALENFSIDTPDLTVSLMMKMMQAWAQQGAGDTAAARVTLQTLPAGSYFSKFGLLQIAELEFGQGNYDAALTALDELDAQDAGTMELEMVLIKARVLDSKGDKAGAIEYLEAYSDENGTFETGPIPAFIATLKSGGALEGPRSPQQNAARALTESSFGFFVKARAFDVAEVFLRLATHLDPDYDKARMWTGEILAYEKRDDEALKMLRSVSEDSPYWVSAKLSESLFFSARERDAEALAVLEDLDAKQSSFVTRGALGRAYLIKEDYAKALPFYEALVGSLSEEELKEDPTNLFLRGVAYTETENWEAARADFERVLSYDPDHSDALNYLGYTWVDRGENLTKAFDMIRRALELEPNSGAITDSLGWAHYKLGQYEEAKKLLEDAVALDPDSATIIDHLGDVYYKLGRKREAGYQWQRALDYDPTDKERRNIQKKLKGGLYAVEAAP